MSWLKITPQEPFFVRRPDGTAEEIQCDSAHITAIGYDYFSGILQLELALGGYDSDGKFQPWPRFARRVMRYSYSRAQHGDLWKQLDFDNVPFLSAAMDALALIVQSGDGVAITIRNYVPEISPVQSELCDDDGNPIQMQEDASPERPETVIPWADLIGKFIKPGTVTQTDDGEFYKAIVLMMGSPQTAPPNINLWRKYRDTTAGGEDWPEWIQPIDRYDSYMLNAQVTRNGKRYISLVDYNVWDPALYIQPPVWREEEETGGGEEPDEWPPFVKPAGAHDAYKMGDKITWTAATGGDGSRYISIFDGANIWSPGEYPPAWERQS